MSNYDVNSVDKFIVKICPHLDECKYCGEKKLIKTLCAGDTNCIYKQIIYACMEFKDKGRFDVVMNSKHLTDKGKMAKNILTLMQVEIVREDEQA